MRNDSPDDYDSRGQLRLPLSFWLILLLQARTWVLFIVAGASRSQGDALLRLFYPDTQAFWLGIVSGLPAAVGLLLTGYRQRLPRLWQAWRWVLVITFGITLLSQSVAFFQQDAPASPLAVVLSAFDALAVALFFCHRRLKDCFDPAQNS